MKADAVIVGSGVFGASVAYYLAKLGVTRTVVVEQGDLGGEATSKSAGHVRYHYSYPILIDIARRGREKLEQFEAEIGVDSGFQRCGYLAVVEEREMPHLVEIVEMQRSMGIDAEVLSGDEVRKRFPYLTSSKIVGGALEKDGGHADPYRVANGYLTRARELGATTWGNTTVTGIEMSGGKVASVLTTRGAVTTSLVINAAGAGAGEVARMIGWEIPIVPRLKRTIVNLTLPRPLWSPFPVTSCPSANFYFSPHGARAFLVGSRELPGESGYSSDDEMIARMIDLLVDYVAGVEDASVQGHWSAFDGDTPDYQPLIGECPSVPGFYVVSGFSGHGFKLAPAIGEAVAEWIVKGRWGALDLSPFHPGRLQGGSSPFNKVYRKMGA